MQTKFAVSLAALATVLSIVLGSGCSCSSGLRRQPIHGKVVSERPVQLVTFRPVDGLKAPAVTSEVKDGAYRFSRADGPIAGDYQVVFQFADIDVSFTGGGKKPKEFAPPPVLDPRTRQPLPAPPPPPTEAVLNVTVPAGGSLEIDLVVP